MHIMLSNTLPHMQPHALTWRDRQVVCKQIINNLIWAQ